MDIGLKYVGNNEYKLFHWSAPNTCVKPGDESDDIIKIYPSEKVTMTGVVYSNKIVVIVKSISYTADMKRDFTSGCRIFRQITIASNRKSYERDYLPCDTYFYNGIFSRGTLTTVSWGYEKFSPLNTRVTLTEEADNGNTDYKPIYLSDISIDGQCGYDREDYCYETASVDLRGPGRL